MKKETESRPAQSSAVGAKKRRAESPLEEEVPHAKKKGAAVKRGAAVKKEKSGARVKLEPSEFAIDEEWNRFPGLPTSVQ